MTAGPFPCHCSMVLVAFLGAISLPTRSESAGDPSWVQLLDNPAKRAAIAALIGSCDYGVPASPAFALLPGKPTEVIHALTPHDLQASALSWFDGQRLRAGLALDSRPFVESVGSMLRYRASEAARIRFGTVISAGTVTTGKGSSDVIVGLGIRVPLVDCGDPRRDDRLLDSLGMSLVSAIRGSSGQPDKDLNETAADVQRAIDANKSERLAIFNRWKAQHWNALRWELGIGGSARSSAGFIRGDSFFSHRAGVWTSASGALTSSGQWTLAAGTTWIRADSTRQETGRQVAGASLRTLVGERLSARAEVSGIWSRHLRATALDEDWRHIAGVLEWYVPEIKGWVGFGYGGDTPHQGRSADGVQLTYAFYRDRVLTR